MSITLAVNAADTTNGPQTVCQSAQQNNNCAEYNGGGIGGDDNDDMAVFDHEKHQHEQHEKDCRNHINQEKDCCYNLRDFIRTKQINEDNEIQKWETKWNSLMSYIRTVYRMAMDGVEVERYPPHDIFKEAAYESKSCDSYHVFQNVENLVMEFVLEARARQVQILEKKNKETPEMPQVFVFCLLDSYRRLMAATDHLKDVIKPIEEYHLSKFNLSWRMMNQYLYHSRLYADRTIYHLVTTFIEQILSTPVLSKSVLSANLIHDYTKFVKEVKLNISEWAEARTCIHNLKCNEVWAMGSEKCKESMLKEENGLYPWSPPITSNDELVIDLSIPTPPQSPAPEYQERVDDCDDIDDDRGSNYCDCLHDHPPTVDSQQNSSVDFDLYAHNGKCSNSQENLETSSLTFSYSNMKEKMLCFYSGETLTDEEEKPGLLETITKLGKKVLNSDAQSKLKPVANAKCSTNADRNITCKVELEQLPKRRYPYPNVSKSEPATKPSNRPLHGHSCHKHTEHVKRMHHHDETSECSSGRSSQDDSCSERSTSSPRQCDCCYCEVFGHGVPSVAPVSRNYQEMRDRLRNLYLLKKAKQNVNHPINDSVKQKQKEPNVVRPQPVHPSNQPSQSNDRSGAIKGVQQKKKVESLISPNAVSEKPKLIKDKQGLSEKPIDELVNFIEGNKAINEKRAAKKARRREKKEEMERIKKEEEEAEQKRIEEEERKKQEIERRKREEALKKDKKKGKNQNKPQKQNQQQKQTTNLKTQPITKPQVQQNTQSSKKKNKQSQGNVKETLVTKKDEKCKKDVEGAKMVTIKRDSDSSKVTITFRGAVEDDVLCTLYDNEAIKAIQRLCDKNTKQPQDQIEEKPNKKRRNRKKKQTDQLDSQPQPKPVESVLITNKNAPKLPTNMKWYCSPDVNITPVINTTNSNPPKPNTVLIKRTTDNQVFTHPMPPLSQPMPLTSPTAIQINEAVNKISSSSSPIDINKLQLPPGITITKLDPSDYKPPRDIQQSTEKPKPSPLQFPFAQPAAVAPFAMQPNAQNNVVVVKTDGYDYERSTEWSGTSSKRHRRRKKVNGSNLDETNSENIQPGFTITNKSSRDPCNEEGKTIAGQIPTNTQRAIPMPVIIQRHGGMVTIRNPLYQRNDDAILTETSDPRVNGGDDDDVNPSGKRRRRRRRVKGGSKQTDVEESVFEPKDIDLEDGEMDDDERELEAFKRFCLQSVPPQRKEKVHLNIKDIVLKKKSTAAAAAAAVGCV